MIPFISQIRKDRREIIENISLLATGGAQGQRLNVKGHKAVDVLCHDCGHEAGDVVS